MKKFPVGMGTLLYTRSLIGHHSLVMVMNSYFVRSRCRVLIPGEHGITENDDTVELGMDFLANFALKDVVLS